MIRLAFAVFRKDLRLSLLRSNGLLQALLLGLLLVFTFSAALPAFCRRKRRLRFSGWLPFFARS